MELNRTRNPVIPDPNVSPALKLVTSAKFRNIKIVSAIIQNMNENERTKAKKTYNFYKHA